MVEKTSGFFKVIPRELWEPNWRVWSFVLLLVAAVGTFIEFPVAPFNGYVDPFYSPTVLVLPFVGLFRLTCYAYRKDYYRHVFNHPRSCMTPARAESKHKGYSGETNLFAISNLHRYFLYIGIAILPFFYYDFATSLFLSGDFVIRLGSIILLVNAILVSLWTFSCHAFRHLTGGNVDCYSCTSAPKFRKGFFNRQSILNGHHEAFAFLSLAFIVGVDLYMRALSAGWHIDFTLLSLHL